MKILGVARGTHDPSAALIIDGKIVAAAEEERFNRVKHAFGYEPLLSAKYCLNQAGITPQDLDAIAFSGSPAIYRELRWRYARRCFPTRIDRAFKAIWKTKERMKLWKKGEESFAKALGINLKKTKLEHVEHHLAHASSCFHVSGFEDAAILTMDGVGEFTCTLMANGLGGEIRKIHEMVSPDSLGLFYSTLTEYLGFRRNNGEFKLMGMSAFGEVGKVNMSDMITYKNRQVRINDDFIWVIKSKRHRNDKRYSQSMVDRWGPPRSGDGLSEPYIHIAAETQHMLEQITRGIIDDYLTADLKRTGTLCFAGGCALNVRLNRKLLSHPLIDRMYVQAAAHDAGLSLGAATYVSRKYGVPCQSMHHAYYGPDYSNEEIKAALDKYRIPYTKCDDIVETGAQILADGEALSWFQGRMEFGPRALGNRSILGHPAQASMSDEINQRIKFREKWRPFCPSILEEDAPEILGTDHPAPFMNLSFTVTDEWRKKIPEVVHVDGSARAQTVNKEANPLYHQLISKFKEKTGLPVLLNTSLNRRTEPMVCSPDDAIAMFYGSGLEFMMMGNYLITKRK